jgi:dATP pyrophosphohydrolase
MTQDKKPVSVLVVIHTPKLEVLLIERAGHAGYWQSVTGSQEGDETLIATAAREVSEETGITAGQSAFIDWQLSNRFEIFAEWRYRYAPGITHNTEHVYSLQIAAPQPVTLAPDEHLNYLWLPWQEAAAKCFSWSNRDAILMLREKFAR